MKKADKKSSDQQGTDAGKPLLFTRLTQVSRSWVKEQQKLSKEEVSNRDMDEDRDWWSCDH